MWGRGISDSLTPQIKPEVCDQSPPQCVYLAGSKGLCVAAASFTPMTA